MKTIVMADLHGYLPVVTDKFDLMLICGDISPVDMPHTPDVQKGWLFDTFVDWINNLPYNDKESKVIMIAGNHDFYLEQISRKSKDALRHVTDGRLVYLDNEEYDFNGKRIFGCPYCKPFGNWAFMRPNMDKYYSFIPKNIDILMCHDAPDIDGLGKIESGRWNGENAGNKVLAEYILEMKPKMVFCGHIHSCAGKVVNKDGIQLFGTSIMNEDYEPVNKPLSIEIM